MVSAGLLLRRLVAGFTGERFELRGLAWATGRSFGLSANHLYGVRILLTSDRLIVKITAVPQSKPLTDYFSSRCSSFADDPCDRDDDQRYKLHLARSSDPGSSPALPTITYVLGYRASQGMSRGPTPSEQRINGT
jgi:hypothetical protein